MNLSNFAVRRHARRPLRIATCVGIAELAQRSENERNLRRLDRMTKHRALHQTKTMAGEARGSRTKTKGSKYDNVSGSLLTLKMPGSLSLKRLRMLLLGNIGPERTGVDGNGAAADQLEFNRAEFAHGVEFTRIDIHINHPLVERNE